VLSVKPLDRMSKDSLAMKQGGLYSRSFQARISRVQSAARNQKHSFQTSQRAQMKPFLFVGPRCKGLRLVVYNVVVQLPRKARNPPARPPAP
jgi:hypothetical protein